MRLPRCGIYFFVVSKRLNNIFKIKKIFHLFMINLSAMQFRLRFLLIVAFVGIISCILIINFVILNDSQPYETISDMISHHMSYIPYFTEKDFSKCLSLRSQSKYDEYQYLIKPKPCANHISLLWLIKSSGYRNGLRFALRKSWARNVSEKFKTIFLLGSFKNNQSMSLIRENEIFGDILQGNFVDSIENVKDKVFMGIQYAKEYCPNVQYFIIADDDSVNLPWNLLPYLKRFDDVDELYTGFFFLDNRPVWNHKSRWYVSKESYSCNVFPKYASGQMIVLNYKSLLKMDSLYRKYVPISMDDALLGVFASMDNITAREIAWNITSGDCISLLSAHNGKSNEGLLGCHNADLPEHQKQLWTELCYSSLSTDTDRKLLQLFCSDYSLH